ncbi:hypothetical protein Slin15195_G093280 [Septoria linicola]|uniref:Uncharacterized protein n=1 Tax=Septoria linicola TaxID=215465 RepID=A0A9Q9EMZ0_9PEZI|nr:hypothetical protein Slin14017_G056390 [Septoria linicola]USW56009.1 hypothetical protein Slin15195_G093280 [Septoria linicola]
MADEDAEAAMAVGSFTRQSLRKQFPFPRTAILEELAEDFTSRCNQVLTEQRPVVQAAKARTSFFSLSAELRNAIYELILVGEKRDLQPNDVGYKRQARDGLSLALLSANRQVRAEASPIFWGQKNFIMTIDSALVGSSKSPMHDWLQKIGVENAKLIKRVEFRLPDIQPNIEAARFLYFLLRSVQEPMFSDSKTIHELALSACGCLDQGVEASKLSFILQDPRTKQHSELYRDVPGVEPDEDVHTSGFYYGPPPRARWTPRSLRL